MINQVPKKITGFRADVINQIIDYLAFITPLDGHQIKYDRTTHGTLPFFRGREQAREMRQFKRLFDLYDVKEDSVKVFIGRFPSFFWQGQMVDLTEPMEKITIEDDSYIYVSFDASTGTATIEITEGKDDLKGTDTVENYPLWFIPFNDNKISEDGIIDLRDTIHMTGMAG